MINIIKDDKNLIKEIENIDPKILEETKENSENISKIVSLSEIQKEIWELQRLKRSLKENKDNFKIFEKKIKDLYEKYRKNESIFTKEIKKDLDNLFNFYDFFRFLKRKIKKVKTEIKKNKNTKKEILIIWQIHFTKDWEWNVYAEFSQILIDIFLEYFLGDNLIIWTELSGTSDHLNYEKDIEKNLKFYLENKNHIKFQDDYIAVFWERNRNKIEKYFKNLEMITFFWKQYFKKDDENFFKNLCIYKYFIHTFIKNENWILSEINYEDFKFMSFWKKDFVNIEAEENPIFIDPKRYWYFRDKPIFLQEEIKKDLEENFFANWFEYFLGNNLEKLFEKYFIEDNILLEEFNKLNKIKNNYIDLKRDFISEEEIKNYEEIEKIQKKILKINYDFYFSDLLKISKDENSDFKEKIEKLILNLDFKIEGFKKDFWNLGFINFFEFILKEIYNYLVFTYRETNTIENIEKYFPKNQKQIPIIFWSWHNENWKKIVEKHNEKNPKNHYSLKIIDFCPDEFDL